MPYLSALASGTGAADGATLDFRDGRLPLIFLASGAVQTGVEAINIQQQNLAGTWLTIGTLTLASPRFRVETPGIFRASRGVITTSSGAEYDVIPTS